MERYLTEVLRHLGHIEEVLMEISQELRSLGEAEQSRPLPSNGVEFIETELPF